MNKYHYYKIWAFPDRIKKFQEQGWEFVQFILRDPGYAPDDYPEHMAILRKLK